MDDSLLQALPLLSDPQPDDLLLAGDKSANYAPKRLPLEAAMNMILNQNGAFTISEGPLKLLAYMNANGNKIEGLKTATADNDAVNYGQVKAAYQSLAAITPGSPSATDKGDFLRVAIATITNPWGGFYLFYWCVDTSPATSLSISGANIVASSGATVHFDGSVANIVNIGKDAGWQGKYFHVACRYRNITSISPLSPTGSISIGSPGFSDAINEDPPPQTTDLSVSSSENAIIISAKRPEFVPLGMKYRAEILLDDNPDNQITGTEPGLITIIGTDPVFRYDLPLWIRKKTHCHARIVSVSLMHQECFTDTLHCPLSMDTDIMSDSYLNFIALKMSERMQTQDGMPLKPK